MAERSAGPADAAVPVFRMHGGMGGPRFGGGGPRWMQPRVRPANAGRTLARLWTYFRGERKRLAIVALLIAADGCVLVAAPRLIGMAIDAVSAAGGGTPARLSALATAVIALALAYLTDFVLNLGQGLIMAGASQRMVFGLRRAMFDKLQRLPIAFFDGRVHGDLMSRLANDIDNISVTVSQSATQIMSTVINIGGSLGMMLALSPRLTLASLVTVPLVFLLARGVSRRTRVLFKDQQAALGRLNGHIEETISGIQAVKAFNREERVIGEFEETNVRLRDIGTKAQIWSGFVMPLMNVINNLGFVAVAGVGGILAIRGFLTVGTIASFLGYSRQFARPLNELANTYNALQAAIAGAERVFEILDEAEEIADGPRAASLASPRGEVEFVGVGFSYRPGTKVLDGISFKAESGSVTALVGPTGAGKTTIVNLLARFYDVSEGMIMIDGRDIREYARDDLRRGFGIVLQDTYLFSGTVRENIRYGNPTASDDDIMRAAATAEADRFIRRLPRGYDTPLSESGSSLSQGQRQLLAIARVILTDPAILILDEATSNVDTRTELNIQGAMLALMRGRTSFIIAHRLSTVRDADRILVIDGGRIVASGDHRSLLERNGLYRRMYRGGE